MLLMHNACATENDLSTSVLSLHPWWLICFHPLKLNCHQLLKLRFLSIHAPHLLCDGSTFLLSVLFNQFCTSSTYYLLLPRPQLPSTSPLSVLVSLPLFILCLLSHSQVHGSIMQGFYAASLSKKTLFLIMVCVLPQWFCGFPRLCLFLWYLLRGHRSQNYHLETRVAQRAGCMSSELIAFIFKCFETVCASCWS